MAVRPLTYPNLILYNGNIRTFLSETSTCEALACGGSRIVAVGKSEDIRRLAGPDTQTIDLQGRTAIPGLTDTHVHLSEKGTAEMELVDCRDFYVEVASVADILQRLANAAAKAPKGSWIVAHGSPMQDFRMLTTALRINREVGGNLAETIEALADTLRRKATMEGKIASLTAQGKLQGLVMTGLPVLLGVLLNFLEPEAMRKLWTTGIGWTVLSIIVVMELLGYFMIRKITSIDV